MVPGGYWGGRIDSELTMNSQCTHWVNAPLPPVSGTLREVPGSRPSNYVPFLTISRVDRAFDHRSNSREGERTECGQEKDNFIPQTLRCYATRMENNLEEVVHPWDEDLLAGHPLVMEREDGRPENPPNTKEDRATTPTPGEHARPSNPTPRRWEERLREADLLESYDTSFPTPEDVFLTPVPAKPGKGLLAARQIFPIARYDEEDDYEFYATGVTGGDRAFTRWVHCEFIVSSEPIRPPNTHRVPW
jgi:hypothetical protein